MDGFNPNEVRLKAGTFNTPKMAKKTKDSRKIGVPSGGDTSGPYIMKESTAANPPNGQNFTNQSSDYPLLSTKHAKKGKY